MIEQLSYKTSTMLQKMGIVVESIWVYLPGSESAVRKNMVDINYGYTPSPIFEELLSILPSYIKNLNFGHGQYDLNICKNQDGTKVFVGYETYHHDILTKSEHSHKYAVEALGELAIWLKENGLLEEKEGKNCTFDEFLTDKIAQSAKTLGVSSHRLLKELKS